MRSLCSKFDLKRRYIEFTVILGQICFYILLIPYIIKLLFKYYKDDAHSFSKDVRYHAKRPRNTLNVYQPSSPKTKHPVIVFVHGGVWYSGGKMHYHYLAKFFQQQGFLVFVLNYTLYPKAYMEDMVEDVTHGLQWVVDHAEEYNGDKANMFLMGHSAGAHLIMSALVQKYNLLHKEQTTTWQPNEFKAFFGLAGVYDLATHYLFEKGRNVHMLSPMAKAGRGVESLKHYSPALHLQQHLQQEDSTEDVKTLAALQFQKVQLDLDRMALTFPKCFFLHGTDDFVVPASQRLKMIEILNQVVQVEHKAEHVPLEKFGHAEPVTCFLRIKSAQHLSGTMWQSLSTCFAKVGLKLAK